MEAALGAAKQATGAGSDHLEQISPGGESSENEPGGDPEAEKATAARLRTRYLSAWSGGLLGQSVTMQLHQQSEPVEGRLLATDSQQSEVLVAQLPTALGTIPNARIRTDDVVWIEASLGEAAAKE
jgi:hypothetical protein